MKAAAILFSALAAVAVASPFNLTSLRKNDTAPAAANGTTPITLTLPYCIRNCNLDESIKNSTTGRFISDALFRCRSRQGIARLARYCVATNLCGGHSFWDKVAPGYDKICYINTSTPDQ
ncbi:hypothetical protein IF1G_00749 [Cordyceps javanica]|uniref:Extracellular membrane protein CFEM domain-containing protein n=1 Tax=Cordyceps javanica TaxID=43265 RepID=A0A545WDS7_9HYPO|nr:hypothetical protein IF1G_00749 [Cordyceps javanica]TQW11995.1 hypothetical protein IF2G_00726 [Cordyceps javanica]